MDQWISGSWIRNRLVTSAATGLVCYTMEIMTPAEAQPAETKAAKPKWIRSVLRIGAALAIVYALALLAVFLGQRRLLYFPMQVTATESVAMATRAGFEAWENNGRIIGWKQISKAGPH